jgi:hypothetical protein
MSATPDFSQAEVLDYTIVGGDPKARLRLSDGSIIQVKLLLRDVYRTGFDSSTGMPAYAVQSQIIISLVEVPKRLRRQKAIPGGVA